MKSFQAPLKPLVITVSRKGPYNYNFIFSYWLYQVKKINQFGDHMWQNDKGHLISSELFMLLLSYLIFSMNGKLNWFK